MTTIAIPRALLEQALESMCWAARTLDIDPDEAQNYHRSLENIRAALAAPAHQEQLKPGECWPERIMKQWDAMRDLIATGDKTSLPRDWFESLAEMRLIEAPATAPAWHDAPTEVKQIAEVLRQIGLTLVRTGDGYKVLKLGAITAQEDKP